MKYWYGYVLGAVVFAVMLAVPLLFYRSEYAYAKRFREVTPKKFYRCGQISAEGLEDAIRSHGIKTVINLQHEAPDPIMMDRFFRPTKKRESEMCEELGTKYLLLHVDLLPRNLIPEERPWVIDEYLKILDDPDAYPILLHCRAGLHRTGLLTAIYRIEYEGWSVASAVHELRANGFGDSACTSADDYVKQILEIYRRGERHLPRMGNGIVAGSAVWWLAPSRKGSP